MPAKGLLYGSIISLLIWSALLFLACGSIRGTTPAVDVDTPLVRTFVAPEMSDFREAFRADPTCARWTCELACADETP